MDDQGQSDKLCLSFVLEILNSLPPFLLVGEGGLGSYSLLGQLLTAWALHTRQGGFLCPGVRPNSTDSETSFDKVICKQNLKEFKFCILVLAIVTSHLVDSCA